jgi:hypothetical protein
MFKVQHILVQMGETDQGLEFGIAFWPEYFPGIGF